jgi:hydroxyethylthiazole kinase
MTQEINTQAVTDVLLAIREKSPLVHNITNYVVMNNTANALLAVGASPIMAHAQEEVREMVQISSSLVINIGTLSPAWIQAMEIAVDQAQKTKTPWVLDPVGYGASAIRNQTVADLCKIAPPAILRGNASEIMGIAAQAGAIKGVDSTAASHEALEAARLLVNVWNNTISISGAVDHVASAGRLTQIHNGSALMTQVTGMGCTATAINGACLGVCDDTHLAAVSAMALMGVCGNMAAEKAQGPGSFQMHFLDALYQISPDDLEQRLKLEHHAL